MNTRSSRLQIAATLLSDGRFPSGGHAHSNGYEAASRAFDLGSVEATERYVTGRLQTTGRSEAAFVAATIWHLEYRVDLYPSLWQLLDAEADARIANRPLKELSRSLGRQWVRAGLRIWDTENLRSLSRSTEAGPHQVVAFAAVALASGLTIRSAVATHLHHLVSGVGTAAVRLHGLDPFEIQAMQWRLIATIDSVIDEAAGYALQPLDQLPAFSSPLADAMAQDHANWDSRLFQS